MLGINPISGKLSRAENRWLNIRLDNLKRRKAGGPKMEADSTDNEDDDDYNGPFAIMHKNSYNAI